MLTKAQYDEMSFSPDLFSLLHPSSADSLGLSDGDVNWAFDTETDPAQIHMHFSDIGSTDIEIPDVTDLQPPMDSHFNLDADADVFASHESPAGYQMSSGSSLSVPISRSPSTSASSAALFQPPSSLSSAAPNARFSDLTEGQVHTQHQLQPKLCTSQQCLAAALRILRTLHIAHSACLSAHREDPTARQTRKMETVLSMNRDVVAGMGPILACPCSGKSLVQLLLLSICGNLVAWNSAMISANLDQSDDLFSPVSAFSADPSRASRARVLAQPITIGKHQIDGKLGRVLQTQIMAGEMRILEGLVDALSRRFCEASSAEVASSTSPTNPRKRDADGQTASARDIHSFQSKSLSTHVYRNIISSLRTRLEHTRGQIFSQG